MAAELLRRLWSIRREALGAALHWSGAGRAFEVAARPAGAIVLMFHSVARDDAAAFIAPPNRLPPQLFERQMAFLSRHRRVVPLAQVVEQVAAGATPAAGTVCITFDDGYRDNLTVAAPILEKYQLPATLFLATGYVSRGEAQWADVLHVLLHKRTADRLELSQSGAGDFNLASVAGRAAARDSIHPRLLEATPGGRRQLLMEIERQLRPRGTAPRLTMTWDEARELRRRFPLFEIGGHTREHLDLRAHGGEAARLEIDGCAGDIRRELGEPPRYFSFPYGRWCKETRGIVCASGWRAAVGASNDIRVGSASDRFVMARVDAPRTMTGLRFKTSGAYPGVFSMLGLR